MIEQSILSLLNRRGVWMTAVEIFDDSPDYPLGDYVLNDLNTLTANGLLNRRTRAKSRLVEYGLPSWVKNATPPAPTLSYLLYVFNRLIRQVLALT